MRNLIVNADDFGYNDDTFRATVSCFEAGLLTSATILAGKSASLQAYDYARKNHERFSFGLHFNITEGCPMSGGNSSLSDENGLFRRSLPQRKHAMAGLLRESDIRREFRCQLSELLDHGVNVTHVDGHHHMHKLPLVLHAIKKEMAEFGIKWIRRPQNFYLYKSWLRGAANKLLLLQFNGLKYSDCYFGVYADRPDWHLRLPDLIPDGLTEISLHPGIDEPWRRAECEPFLAPAELRASLERRDIVLRRHGELERVS
ncbi:Chitooligosaccharide deacetylase [Cupriavidus laharis]|uniref:Chitooligosaccharide deacetylase n=1 Tax=Cupriavidus laharis TaxID=151654 RepID=A0ABM8XB57_9BURK|nr:ChbG/HpnK family deacetylase [Cupriavidus laharis]CAG9177264.1 Chitooligosaccharide deacetylase [Cupriavidus laharis]